jgi:hypothetical protein
MQNRARKYRVRQKRRRKEREGREVQSGSVLV